VRKTRKDEYQMTYSQYKSQPVESYDLKVIGIQVKKNNVNQKIQKPLSVYLSGF